MKMVLSGQVKGVIRVVIVICLLVVALFNVVGYYFNCKYISVFAAVAEVDKYEVRNELLMDAMNQVGVNNPESAAKVWANGLKARSAALQYSVLGTKLRQEYAKQLDENYPNWVTGMSSPWVDSYKITDVSAAGDDRYAIKVSFSTATSAGPAGDYNALLIVAREGDFWRIADISADKELYPYIGFSL